MPALPLLLIGVAAITAAETSPAQTTAASAISRTPVTISIALVIFFSLFSISATRDYFNWNRARWRALNELVAGGKVIPEDVDGGFEFNGWYLYDPNYKSPKGKNFWWVHRNDYMVAFGEQPRYRITKEYPYSNWLPPQRRRVLLLHKEPD